MEGMRGSTLQHLALEFHGDEGYSGVITAEWNPPDDSDSEAKQDTKLHERSHMLRRAYKQAGLLNAIGKDRGDRRVYDDFEGLAAFVLTNANYELSHVGHLNRMSLVGESKRIKSGAADTILTDELLAYSDGARKLLTDEDIGELIHPQKYNCADFIAFYYQLYKDELQEASTEGQFQVDFDQMQFSPFTQQDKDTALSHAEKLALEKIQEMWNKQSQILKEGFQVLQRLTEKYKNANKAIGMLLPFPTRYWRAVERIVETS
jgi:hypothetical protein